MWRRYLENCDVQFLLQWLSYHRFTDQLKLESTSEGHLVQSPAQAGDLKAIWSRFPRAMSRQLLKIFKDWGSTASLGNTCHLHNKKFFLSSSGMSYFKLCLLSSYRMPLKKSLSNLYFPFSNFKANIRYWW